MDFEALKDQLKEQWADLSSKIQENSTFNNVREKFESQSPTTQRVILIFLGAVFALFLFSFPWGYISTSKDNMAEFEENRSLIQGLLHAARAANEPSPLPTPVDSNQIKSQVDAILKENRLIPDQIGEMTPIPDKPAKDLAPPVVVQNGLAVQLKKLNLDQIVNLSHQFQMMGPGMKLMGIDVVQSAGQHHYYDMNARIVNFALAASAPIEESPSPPSKKKSKREKRNDEEIPE